MYGNKKMYNTLERSQKYEEELKSLGSMAPTDMFGTGKVNIHQYNLI